MLIVFAFVCVLVSFSEEYILFTGEVNSYNEIIKSFDKVLYTVKYDDKDKVYYLFLSDYTKKIWIDISENNLMQIRKNIEKYFEWEKIAVEKQVKIEKILPDSAILTEVSWKEFDCWYNSYLLKISFTFFSQNTSRHQLVVFTNKAQSIESKYNSYEIEGLYFDKEDVEYLYSQIEENNIASLIQKHNDQKDTESLFK
jgi:hypothetical protein